MSRRVWRVFLGLGDVRDWRLLFPGSCHVRGERPGGSRTGREPGRQRAAPEASLRRLAGSPIIWAAGNGSRGRAGYSVVFQVRPHVPGHPVRAVPLAAVIPSRVPGQDRGAWGGSASEEAVRRGQSNGRPRRR